jgi:hypothetical protein
MVGELGRGLLELIRGERQGGDAHKGYRGMRASGSSKVVVQVGNGRLLILDPLTQP